MTNNNILYYILYITHIFVNYYLKCVWMFQFKVSIGNNTDEYNIILYLFLLLEIENNFYFAEINCYLTFNYYL